MRPTKVKQQKPSVKLPSIGNKSFGDISAQSLAQKQRPLSSKNIVSDLQKKLFSQLDAYQEKTLTLKNTRKSINKNNNVNKKQSVQSNPLATYLSSNSCKEISNMNLLTNTNDLASMEKLAQLMPQLYSKIINNKKYEDDYEPLKESNITNNTIQTNNTLITEIKPEVSKNLSTHSRNISKQMQPSKNNQKLKTINSTILGSKSINNARSISITRASKQKQATEQKSQLEDSFVFAQNEVNKIYKQYLEQQGLEQDNYNLTSLDDLHHMNEDLMKCQVNIDELQKNYEKLIKQLGNICLNDLEDKMN